MNEEHEHRQSSEKPAMNEPQEEFIGQEAVPSKPEKFGGEPEQADREKTPPAEKRP